MSVQNYEMLLLLVEDVSTVYMECYYLGNGMSVLCVWNAITSVSGCQYSMYGMLVQRVADVSRLCVECYYLG